MMFEPIYQGKTYSELEKIKIIVCLANEFIVTLISNRVLEIYPF